MRSLIDHLQSGSDLVPTQIEEAVGELISPAVTDETKANFLKALRAKGETPAEIAGFVEAFLAHSIRPALGTLPGPTIDVCGTGGDRMDFFNISTATMFLMAAGGAVVVKHGNRGITSKCGGADVLEELGVRIDSGDPHRILEEVGAAFLFAPSYHPAFKMIAPARKRLAAEGQGSIFNMLGPLLNPARPDYQLVGVYSSALLPTFAEVFALLKRKEAWAVHGSGTDELSTTGPSDVVKFRAGRIEQSILDPESLGLERVSPADLLGGDRAENARILTGILDGSLRGPKREVVVLNAAAGFVITGLAPDMPSGLALAREQLDSGRALARLRAMIEASAR